MEPTNTFDEQPPRGWIPGGVAPKEKINLDITPNQRFILFLVGIILAYSFFTVGMVMSLMGGK